MITWIDKKIGCIRTLPSKIKKKWDSSRIKKEWDSSTIIKKKCVSFYRKCVSFYRRRMLFLVTLGTILSATFFGLIQWWVTKCPTSISITTPDCYMSTDSMSLGAKLLLTAILSIFFTYLFDKRRHKKRIQSHFTHSYDIVTKKIIEIFSKKSVLKNYRGLNKNIDKIIKSPLDYAAETLNGNLVPFFRPNDRYLDDIYDENVDLIIAATAENPNLWLDPTICFYLINCCAVSLKRSGTGRIRMQNFGDNPLIYRDRILAQLEYLNRLTGPTLNRENFDFFRFFFYDEGQEQCLQNTVFPSLKASHDLFNIKSYFNKIEDIKCRLDTQIDLFCECVDFLWEAINSQNLLRTPEFKNVIEKRKRNHTPEFLFLFKTVNIRTVTVHTFVDGNPYFVVFNENDDGYQRSQTLVSLIARSVRDTGIVGQYIPVNNYLNTRNSYIEWV